MEPRSIERGKLEGRKTQTRRVVLQWSRDQLNAESGELISGSPVPLGFNGAAIN